MGSFIINEIIEILNTRRSILTKTNRNNNEGYTKHNANKCSNVQNVHLPN